MIHNPSPTEPLDSGSLEIANITKGFSHRRGVFHQVLGEISFNVAGGEFVTIIGPSGSGKSTLLKIIAGLETPDQGTVHLAGKPITSPTRQMGMVFQEHVLLPWLTAKQNVLFALEADGSSPGTVQQRHDIAEYWLNQVQLSDAQDLKPGQMSGGMQQRVGIARAFALESDVLLLDEPLGALDALTRHDLQQQLVYLSEHESRTFVLVTHSVDEALLLSDRVLVLSAGPAARIEQDLQVPFARPRDRQSLEESATYLQLRQHLLTTLTQATHERNTAARSAVSSRSK
jgi:nitrate/nitrite transport system ATP-binding protein